jgi:hypothetical protein
VGITREKPDAKQRKNTDKTKKEQRNAAHLLAGYQPPNETNKTPKKRAESEESETLNSFREITLS